MAWQPLLNPVIHWMNTSPRFWCGWGMACLFVILAGGAAYAVLSALGMTITATHLLLLAGVLVGGLVYGLGVERLVQSPGWMLFYILIGWELLTFAGLFLRENGYPTLPVRIITLGVMGVSGVVLVGYRFRRLWEELPPFRYFFIFLGLVTGYFFFYNVHFADPGLAERPYIDYSREFFLNLVLILIAMAFAYLGIRQADNWRLLFLRINLGMLIYKSIEALCIIGGYPFQFLSRNWDGFLRSSGFTIHPNHLAHNEAMWILYLVGLMSYYALLPEGVPKLPRRLLWAALLLALCGLFLAMSKNSMALFTVVMGGYLSVLARYFNMRKPLVMTLCGLCAGIPLFLLLYQGLMGVSFFEILQARVDDQNSLVWRFQIWTDLLDSMEPWAWWVGNGLSATNAWLYTLENKVSLGEPALPLAHNAFLQLLYDMGLVGLGFYGVYGVALWAQWKGLREKALQPERFLYLSAGAILLYFVGVSHFDEVLTTYPTAVLAWTLSTLLFACARKHRKASFDAP